MIIIGLPDVNILFKKRIWMISFVSLKKTNAAIAVLQVCIWFDLSLKSMQKIR